MGSNIGVCRAPSIDDRDQVGPLAGLERCRSRRPCPSARRRDRVAISSADLRRHRPRIDGLRPCASSAASRIASNMSRSLLLAAPSVPSPRAHAVRMPLRHRGDAAGELHVAVGIVRHADAALREHRRCPRRRATRHAPRATRPPEADRLEVLRRRLVWCSSCDDLHFVLRLGEVNQQRHVVLRRQRARGLQRGRRRACTARAARPPA